MSVTIDASEVIFVTESTLDVTTSTISEDALDSKFTLALGKKGDEDLLFATGDTFRGFFTVAPVDLSGKALTITAATDDGKTIVLGTPVKESATSRRAYSPSAQPPLPQHRLRHLMTWNILLCLNDAIAAAINGTANTSEIYLVDDVK